MHHCLVDGSIHVMYRNSVQPGCNYPTIIWGTSGTALLWAPSSNWPGGHFAGASTGHDAFMAGIFSSASSTLTQLQESALARVC